MKFITSAIALVTFFAAAPIAAADHSTSKSSKSETSSSGKSGKAYDCGSLSYSGKSGKGSTSTGSSAKSSKASTKASKSGTMSYSGKSGGGSKCGSKRPTSEPSSTPTKAPSPTTPGDTPPPTVPPTARPTMPPTIPPTAPPTMPPTIPPTPGPTNPSTPTTPSPTTKPTAPPTMPPTMPPTAPPTMPPTIPPTPGPTPFPTIPPTPGPNPLPTNPPIFKPSCPANTSSCLCGTCTEGKCTYTKGAGEDKKPKFLCLTPPAGTCTDSKTNSLSIAARKVVQPGNNIMVKTASPLLNNVPDKCPNGWYWNNEVPNSSGENNGIFYSIDVSSPCVNNNKKVTINTSCGCSNGLCYTYAGSYTITGYQLYGDTTWYYATDGCPNTNQGSATCS